MELGFKPRMTRIYTDKEETQGGASASQAALPNQALWQASLPTRLFPNRSIRFANAPAFRALRETQNCQELEFRRVLPSLEGKMAGLFKEN